MIRRLRKKLLGGVRRQMIVLFLVTVLLTALTGVYVVNPSMQFMKQMDDMFHDTLSLDQLEEDLDRVDGHLQDYLTTRDLDSLLSYYEHSEPLRTKALSMKSTEIGRAHV